MQLQRGAVTVFMLPSCEHAFDIVDDVSGLREVANNGKTWCMNSSWDDVTRGIVHVAEENASSHASKRFIIQFLGATSLTQGGYQYLNNWEEGQAPDEGAIAGAESRTSIRGWGLAGRNWKESYLQPTEFSQKNRLLLPTPPKDSAFGSKKKSHECKSQRNPNGFS